MDPSESETDEFESADEFVSDEETEKTVVVNDHLPKSIPTVDPCVAPIDNRIENDNVEGPTSKATDNYRKRPERKRQIEDPKPISIRPPPLLSDLTGHLTSEFSKGFATFTNTSSSLGSKMGNLVKDMVNIKNEEQVEFDYDDDRTQEEPQPVRSELNEQIIKLSDAFVKLNEARAKEEEEKAAAVAREKEEKEKAAAVVRAKKEEEKAASQAKAKEEKEKAAAVARAKKEEEKAASEARAKEEEEKAAAVARAKEEKEKAASEARAKEEKEKAAAVARAKEKEEKAASQARAKKEEEEKAASEVRAKKEKVASKAITDIKEVSNDSVDAKKLEPESEEIGDDWNDWGDGDKNEKVEEAVPVVEEATNDGWDDWGDEEIVEPEKPAEPENDGWDDWGDDFEEIKPEKQPLESQTSSKEWSGWDSFGQKKDNKTWGASWGIDTLLNTATAVTQGLSTVIESGLGVPDPETMARIQKEETEKMPEDLKIKQTEPDLFPLRHLVGKVAKVQEIGSRVLTGGLDTLETIGKKTMEVLQEGDPGLKKKRALIIGQGQMLSQVLKDARDRAMAENKKSGEKISRRQFETIFDDFQGLVHLEALEMLSKQCEIQIDTIKQSLPQHKVQELLDTLDEVNQLCEIDEDFDNVEIDNFRKDIQNVTAPLKNELSVEKILQVHERLYDWLTSKVGNETACDQIYDEAISTIAELTAAITMQFHKSGELLLVKERRKTVEEADCLLQLSSNLCAELRVITEKCVELLSNNPNEEILVGNLKIESENAISYVKQAFRLLVPVLQLGAT